MKFLSYIILIISVAGISYSQDNTKTEPFNLSEYVVMGKGQVSIQGGVKQMPMKSFPLTKEELDSLNSLQKEQSFLLPPKPLPTTIATRSFADGYFRGEFGRYTTPSVEAGYGKTYDGYNLFGRINFESSSGHVKNSDYISGGFRAVSEYLAPAKFFIFGGSKTLTDLDLSYNNYNLYSVSSAPNRSLLNAGIKLSNAGSFEGFDFVAGAGFNLVSLSDDRKDASETSLSGIIRIKNLTNDFKPGLSAFIDFRSYNSNSINFFDISGFAEKSFGALKLTGEAGLQFSGGTSDATYLTLKMNAGAEYLMNKDFTLKAVIANYLEQAGFDKLIRINPYVSDSVEVLPNNITQLKLSGYYHPNDKLIMILNLSAGTGSRSICWDNSDTSRFFISYKQALLVKLQLEGSYKPTTTDELAGNITLNFNSITETGDLLPYSEPISISAFYRKTFFSDFGTHIGLAYVTGRYADINNKVKLDGFINLSLIFDYQATDDLGFFLKFDNLLNNNIYRWNGFKERNLFLSAGIKYKL